MTIVSSAIRLSELGDEADLPFVALYNYITRRAGSTSSDDGVLTDGALDNAVSGTTYDYWLPDIGGTSVTYSRYFSTGDIAPTFAAIAGHNLGTLGGSVAIQSSPDGVTWTTSDAGTHTPTDDSPIGFRMSKNATKCPYWRFRFSGLTAGDPLYVAVLMMSQETIFPVGIYSGFAPPLKPTEVQLQSNVSIGGNLLGSSVIAQGTTLSAKFTYLTADFVRNATLVLDFIEKFNEGYGFFFAWRPDTFPTDLRYCWRDGAAIVPVNDGGLDYMSIQLAMRAYES